MIEINKLINEKIEFQNFLISFLEESNNDYQSLKNFLDKLQLEENPEELNLFLLFISRILNNYHMTPNFSNTINFIFQHFSGLIKQNFNSIEIFKIFRKSKLALLLLFENNIITMNESMLKFIIETDEKYKLFYYFYPEIKQLIGEKIFQYVDEEFITNNPTIFENINEKRHKGANETYLAELIQNDSIEKFVSLVNQTNLPLNATIIKPSIFETNLYLIENEPTLIEYAAFYKSIQIFKYLLTNKVKLTTNLWFYSIHSNEAEMIQLLEDNNVKIINSYAVIKESIKCHHNDIANYFIDNLYIQKNISIEQETYNSDIIEASIHYSNYNYFPKRFYEKSVIHFLYKYGYKNYALKLIENYKQEKKIHTETNLSTILFPNTYNQILENKRNLTEIIFPSSLSCINRHDFSECYLLTKIKFTSYSITINSLAFKNCMSLRKIVFLSSKIHIKSDAFTHCKSFEKVIFPPSSNVLVELDSFYSCGNIDKLALPFAFTKRNLRNLCPNMKILPTVTSIPGNSFRKSCITRITIPYSVTKIGHHSFSCCYNLVEVNIPSTVTFIGNYAFDKCRSLSAVNIGKNSSLSVIGNCAFRQCISLKTFIIPSTVNKIGKDAFKLCNNLIDFKIPDTVDFIGDEFCK